MQPIPNLVSGLLKTLGGEKYSPDQYREFLSDKLKGPKDVDGGIILKDEYIRLLTKQGSVWDGNETGKFSEIHAGLMLLQKYAMFGERSYAASLIAFANSYVEENLKKNAEAYEFWLYITLGIINAGATSFFALSEVVSQANIQDERFFNELYLRVSAALGHELMSRLNAPISDNRIAFCFLGSLSFNNLVMPSFHLTLDEFHRVMERDMTRVTIGKMSPQGWIVYDIATQLETDDEKRRKVFEHVMLRISSSVTSLAKGLNTSAA